LTTPGKIVCLARSFRLHAVELGNEAPSTPIYFLKATSAIVGPGEPIRLPEVSSEVHHEAELAMVIGQQMSSIDASNALDGVASWTILNDVTARDLQRADGGRFTRAKGFDTFCPISDARLENLPWADTRIQCYVDGEQRQDGALSDLMFPPEQVLAEISQCMTLMPGDIVSLGTPAGVGPLRAVNKVEVRLVGPTGQTLASLVNPVVNR
jgi:2-keto-4-pentenoate hydratase/2-oxohepta-3-ene-1,7-dioic acid hydratase in catechol pathway